MRPLVGIAGQAPAGRRGAQSQHGEQCQWEAGRGNQTPEDRVSAPPEYSRVQFLASLVWKIPEPESSTIRPYTTMCKRWSLIQVLTKQD